MTVASTFPTAAPPGPPRTLRVPTPADLALAQALLAEGGEG